MRKRLLSIVLPLLLLFSQQGAVWHEIAHLHGVPTPAEREYKQQPADKLCESCLAFAHLAATAKPEHPTLRLAAVSFEFAAAEAVHVAASGTPAQRCRGPPFVL